MRMCHFRVQNDPFAIYKIFLHKPLLLLSSTYWPFSWCKILKNSYGESRVMRMRNFWPQNGLFLQMRVFAENLSMSFFSFQPIYMPKIKVRYSFIKEILTIKEYWNLIDREQFLAITWEVDFSQACNFHRMLMKHKNFRFTQIPENTNDMIFLKCPKTLFLGHFDHSAQWPKNPTVTYNYIWASNTMLSFRKN